MKVLRVSFFLFVLLGAFLFLGKAPVLAHTENDTIEFNVHMANLGLPFVEGQILDPRSFWRSASDHRALIFHEHFIARDGAGNPQPDFDGTVLFTFFGGPGYDPTTGLGGVVELPPDIEYEVIEHPASPKVLFQPSKVRDVGIAGVDSDDKGRFQFGDWVYVYKIVNDSGSTAADDPASGWRAETSSTFPIPLDILFFRYGEGYPTDGRPYDPLLPGTTISAIGDVEGTGLNPSPSEANFSTSFTGGGWRVDFILVVNGELEDIHIAIPGGKPYYSNLLYVTSPFGPETTQNSHIATGRDGNEITYTPSTWPTIQCRHFEDVATGEKMVTLNDGETVTVELKICNIPHPDVNPDLQSPFRTLPAAGAVGMIKLPDDPCLIVSKSFDPPIPFYVDNHDPSPPDDGYALGNTCHTEIFTITNDGCEGDCVVFTPLIEIENPYGTYDDPLLYRSPPFNDPLGDPFFFTTLGVNEACSFTVCFPPKIKITKEVKPRGAPNSEYVDWPADPPLDVPLCGEVTFRITVENIGGSDIKYLHVEDDMEACLCHVTEGCGAHLEWNFNYPPGNRFEPGDTRVIVFDAYVNPGASPGLCKNEARAKGTSVDDIDTDEVMDESYVDVHDLDISLSLSVLPSQVPTCGEVTFSINVQNTGDWTLNPVYLSSVTLPPGFDCGTYPGPTENLGPLGPGASYPTITITCEVPNTASGPQEVSATVTGHPDGVPPGVLDCDVSDSKTVQFEVLVPDILVECLSVNPLEAPRCGEVTFTYRITNIGQVRLNPVTLQGPFLDPSLTLVSVTPPGPFDLAVLAHQDVAVVAFVKETAPPGPKGATLGAVGRPFGIADPNDPTCDVQDEDICTLEDVLIPCIALEKTVSADNGVSWHKLVEVQPGDTVKFKVVVTNCSPDVDLDSVEITECINDIGLTNCDDITGPIGALAAGASITKYYECDVAPDAPVGENICDLCTAVGHPAGVEPDVHLCDVEDSDSACVTIPAEGIPTLSEWGLILLSASLMLLLVIRNRRGVFLPTS